MERKRETLYIDKIHSELIFLNIFPFNIKSTFLNPHKADGRASEINVRRSEMHLEPLKNIMTVFN